MAAHRQVINCDAQLAASLFREADQWRARGDRVNEQKALDAARAQLVLAGIDSREAAEAKAEELIPLTAAEETQRQADQDAAAAVATAQAALDVNDATLRDRVDQALTQLATAHTNWGTLTAAQKDAALKLNVRVTLALARLQLRKLDGTD